MNPLIHFPLCSMFISELYPTLMNYRLHLMERDGARSARTELRCSAVYPWTETTKNFGIIWLASMHLPEYWYQMGCTSPNPCKRTCLWRLCFETRVTVKSKSFGFRPLWGRSLALLLFPWVTSIIMAMGPVGTVLVQVEVLTVVQ